MNQNHPALLEDPVLCTIVKNHKQTPTLVAFHYQIQCGVVVLIKSFNKKWIKENIEVMMSGAMGRGLLGNILHEDHSMPISQDFSWVKMSYLFFPVHECLVCIPGRFLLLLWQQEMWHGWRGLTLDRCVCSVSQSSLTLCDPMDCSLPGWSVHGDSSGKNIGVGCHPPSRGSSQPRDRTQVSHIAGRFCTVCITRKAQEHWSW